MAATPTGAESESINANVRPDNAFAAADLPLITSELRANDARRALSVIYANIERALRDYAEETALEPFVLKWSSDSSKKPRRATPAQPHIDCSDREVLIKIITN
jgi:hypothetical protein